MANRAVRQLTIMEIHMTTSESTKAVNAPAGDFALTIRRYLGNRRLLLAAALVALVGGTALNWGWLVALGIAPVLLSLLPCLIMCGLGVGCMKMMAGSGEKQSGQFGNPAGTVESSAAVGIAKMESSSTGAASCCQGGKTHPSRAQQFQSLDERRDSHA
jgi:hypothetical protein